MSSLFPSLSLLRQSADSRFNHVCNPRININNHSLMDDGKMMYGDEDMIMASMEDGKMMHGEDETIASMEDGKMMHADEEDEAVVSMDDEKIDMSMADDSDTEPENQYRLQTPLTIYMMPPMSNHVNHVNHPTDVQIPYHPPAIHPMRLMRRQMPPSIYPNRLHMPHAIYQTHYINHPSANHPHDTQTPYHPSANHPHDAQTPYHHGHLRHMNHMHL